MPPSASDDALPARDFHAAFSRLLFSLGALPYDFLSHLRPWREHCRRMLPPRPDERRVLDVGCGPGVSAIEMALAGGGRDRVVGLDISTAMIARARRRRAAAGVEHLVELVHGDALALPFPEGDFDALTGHSVLYLLPDRDRALAEMRRVLRQGGELALFEPARGLQAHALLHYAPRSPFFAVSMALWRVVSGIAGRFTPEALAKLIESAGFSEVRVDVELEGLGLVVRGVRR